MSEPNINGSWVSTKEIAEHLGITMEKYRIDLQRNGVNQNYTVMKINSGNKEDKPNE